MKNACEWLFLSVSISQTLQEAANFSWLSATLGFTQLTSVPLCVPHTLGSSGSPDEDSAKAMAFAERASKIRAARHALSLAPRSAGAGRGGARAPRHPVRGTPGASRGGPASAPVSAVAGPEERARPCAMSRGQKEACGPPPRRVPHHPSRRTPPRVPSRSPPPRPREAPAAEPTLSCDLETLPLRSRSSAVKACQMALSSSSFKPPMAPAALPRRTRPAQSAPRRLCLPQELHRRRCPPCGHLTPADPAPSGPAPWRPHPSVPPAGPRDGPLCPVWVCKHHAKSLGWVSTPAQASKEMSPIPRSTEDWRDQPLRPLWESHSY